MRAIIGRIFLQETLKKKAPTLEKKVRVMQKSLPFLSVFVALCVLLSGCVYLVVGSVAAVGGYTVSRDTIQGESEQPFDDIWDAAVDIVSIMGTVNSRSRELGKISAIVNGAKVTIHVMPLTSSTTRLKVKARKAVFPSIANAQNIFVKIMSRVNHEAP